MITGGKEPVEHTVDGDRPRFGDPLSPEAVDIVQAFKRVREAQFAAEEVDKRRPRERYLEQAVKAGFSEPQAAFLWEHRHKYQEWMA